MDLNGNGIRKTAWDVAEKTGAPEAVQKKSLKMLQMQFGLIFILVKSHGKIYQGSLNLEFLQCGGRTRSPGH
jgi:hypothetical protein